MGARKIVIAMGSPRKEGNSAALAGQVAAGAEAKGAEVDSFFLHGMDIQPCDACDSCRADSASDCVVEDEMQEIYPKLRQADAVVIASPIYCATVSAQTKLFMDRCYALGGPQGHGLAGKQIGIVLAYADPDPFVSGAVNALRTFQDAYQYVGAEIVGMVYGTADAAGEIRKNQELMDQAYSLGEKLGSGG